MRNLVLLAHPEPAVVQTLAKALQGSGYKTITAPDGAEALASAARYSPQLVIARADLPELQGTEVCLRLKHDPETSAIAIVLLANDDNAGARFVSAQVGADAYLVEPVDKDALCAKVSDMYRDLQLNAKNILRRTT